MKITFRRNLVLGAAILGVSALNLASPSFAAPGDRGGRNERNDGNRGSRSNDDGDRNGRDRHKVTLRQHEKSVQEVKDARQKLKEERKEYRDADTPQERREEKRDVFEAKRDLKKEERDLKRENYYNNQKRPSWNNDRGYYGNNGYYGNGNYGNGYYGNGYYGNDYYGNYGNYGNGYYGGGNSDYNRVFTGRVTQVRDSRSFDVEINGKTYNVYLDSYAPRALNRGDIVEIRGDRLYENDIRNATVRIINNR